MQNADTIEIIVYIKSTAAWLRKALQDAIDHLTARRRKLIELRFQIVDDLVQQMEWQVIVSWVESCKNTAHQFSRIPERWVRLAEPGEVQGVFAAVTVQNIEDLIRQA